MGRLEVLDLGECWRLLGQQRMGRVAFTDRALPAIRPVNYTLVGDQVMLRTRADGLAAVLDRQIVAFEIDGADGEHDLGWSVVVTGTARTVNEPTGAEVAVPPSWAGPDHQTLVRITPGDVQGRRLVKGSADERGSARDVSA